MVAATLGIRVRRACTVLSLAIAVFRLTLAGSPQDANSARPPDESSRADTPAGAGKLEQAIALLEDLRQRQPGAPGIDAKLGKAYYQRRNFPNAIQSLKRALAAGPENAEVRQELALAYFATGQMSQAIPLLEALQVQGGAVEFDASYMLGVSYLKTLEYEKARAAFARMFAVPAESAAGHLLFARMMVRENHEDTAVLELKQAMSIDPHLAMVHFLLGEIYLHQSKTGLALEEFKTELELDPTVWLVYWRLGDAFSRLENYPEAEKALKQAIWLNETFSGPYVLLGQIQLRRGDVDLAIGFLERATQMDPNNYQAHYSLGRSYQKAGQTEKADREFGIARTLLTRKNEQVVQLGEDLLKH